VSKTIEVEALANVHSHLREGDIIGPLISQAIKGGADVLGLMPNTNEGLTTPSQIMEYLTEMKKASAGMPSLCFIPFLMMTEGMFPETIEECLRNNIADAKIYPRDRTTKSEKGVRHYGSILKLIQECESLGFPRMNLHFHPEHPSMIYNNRDAEYAFLPIARLFLEETNARIIWEHGTDARCIPHWEDMAKKDDVTKGDRFFVTLTAHHLVTTEDETFGDVRAVCKPPIKTQADKKALVEFVKKDYPWVMAGGDDAFHDKNKKHVDNGKCACGAYTAPFLLSLYAQALQDLLQTENGIRTFVNFTSRNARQLHNLLKSSRTLRLENTPWKIPLNYQIGSQTAVPFWAGENLDWKLATV